MEKQTAVQYLRSEIKDKDNGEIPKWVYKFINDANIKEKQQIIDAYCKGVNDADNHPMGEKIDWENYYNETYLQ